MFLTFFFFLKNNRMMSYFCYLAENEFCLVISRKKYFLYSCVDAYVRDPHEFIPRGELHSIIVNYLYLKPLGKSVEGKTESVTGTGLQIFLRPCRNSKRSCNFLNLYFLILDIQYLFSFQLVWLDLRRNLRYPQ